MSPQPAKEGERQKTGPEKSAYVPCALLFGDSGPILASHQALGERKISSRLALFMNKDCHPYFGAQLVIPHDEGQKMIRLLICRFLATTRSPASSPAERSRALMIRSPCLSGSGSADGGMFDMISKIIYPDVPFKYGPSAEVSLPAQKEGRAIEAFFRGRFAELSPAPSGKLFPIFIQCRGSRVFTDPRTMSKMSKDQVKIALDSLVEAAKAKQVDVSRVVCISPYPANVGLIEKMRNGRRKGS
ncbi:dna helicase [Fusarium langsethiae]|uniref:Dna helicase n=1 Tax=Fusarium langsethiae TaxID=179993 RepID=A0A0M9ESS2_FUSLA|nr:dna helicase [Fusarium langsethiae]GKU06757.1 unnamed protein product [Fusarium langsethiae]GKU10139.1 unnamed protein product [Fusarium langsethiae]